MDWLALERKGGEVLLRIGGEAAFGAKKENVDILSITLYTLIKCKIIITTIKALESQSLP